MVRLGQEGRTIVRAVRTLIFYIITYTDDTLANTNTDTDTKVLLIRIMP
jgi:hypothetical protein